METYLFFNIFMLLLSIALVVFFNTKNGKRWLKDL